MRKSKIISITLHPDILTQIENLRNNYKQNRSEIIKNIINSYFRFDHESKQSQNPQNKLENISQALKMYYDLTSQQQQKNIIVGLGIITHNNRILIGKRKGSDVFVKHLSWVFPGGAMHSLNFNKELVDIIKSETGLTVKVGKIIHARVHPDNLSDKVNIVALYFHCLIISELEKETPGGFKEEVPLVKLKWVEPTMVTKYFTTSTSDEVMLFLKNIQLGRE